ncbi:MAG: hypothetical protein FWG87_01935 [Defluviitaleaceae bacterium]|nr:hypothetical protein [Defluviitaleaceae bacterium]
MKKQLRKANGLALPTVVLFIIMMATVGTLMVVVSNRSMKMSNATPTLDGHYYAAESAINRAMVGLVSDVSDFSVSAVQEAAKQAAEDIMVAVNARLMSFPHSGANAPNRTDLQDFLVNSFDANAENFQDKIRNAVHDYISGAISLPAPHSATPSMGTSEVYFWLVGADETAPMDGFNTPGYANLARVGTGADADKLRVGLAGVTVTTPAQDSSHPLNEAGEYEVWKTSIGIKPYITFESYAGTVSGTQAITQDIIIPFDEFDVYFGFDVTGGNGGASADGAFWGIIPSALTVGGDNKTKVNGGTNYPTPLPLNSLTSAIDNLRNDIRKKAYGSDTYHMASNVPGPAHTVEVVMIDGERRLRINGNGSANTMANTMAVPPNNRLVIDSPSSGVTLMGDFSGMSIVGQNIPVFLGSADSNPKPKPFISSNSSNNETFIFTQSNITVNVSDGTTLNNVSVGTTQNMSFQSHGVPGTVLMNAVFAANTMPDGEIKASEWSTNQLPQFYARGTLQLRMEGKDKDGKGIAMGGLFANADGAQTQIEIDNGGADFNGLFAAPPSSGSYVRGDTNFISPPKFADEAMDVLDDLAVQINSSGGGGGGSDDPPSYSFDSSSWGVNTDTADVPTAPPSFHTP